MNDCRTKQSVTDWRARVTQAPRDDAEVDGKVGDGATLAAQSFRCVDCERRRDSPPHVVTGPDGPSAARETLGECVKHQRTNTRTHRSVDKIAIYY